jgi:hypothetical protein
MPVADPAACVNAAGWVSTPSWWYGHKMSIAFDKAFVATEENHAYLSGRQIPQGSR